jgi:hypothetical protein
MIKDEIINIIQVPGLGFELRTRAQKPHIATTSDIGDFILVYKIVFGGLVYFHPTRGRTLNNF